MTQTVSSQADQSGIAAIDQQAQSAIADAATAGAISSSEFVFVASFDGTGNTQTDAPKANNQTTNVEQLNSEIATGAPTNVFAAYYAGVGTPGMEFGSSAVPTSQIVATAQRAYNDFVREASNWLSLPGNKGKSVTAVLTAFSRGAGSAAVFSQLLFEKGLVTTDGTILVPPGQVGISAGVLFDPVTTGTGGNLAFAPNATNIVQIAAENEYRSSFRRTDFSVGDAGITSISMIGNHSDIGGGYDNGIGALSLAGANQFLSNSGLPIGPVAASRVFNQSQVYVHNEDTFHGLHWPQDAAFSDESSLTAQPARLISKNPQQSVVQASGQSTTQTLLLQDNSTVKITTTVGSTDELVEIDNPNPPSPTSDVKHYVQNSDNSWGIADEVKGALSSNSDDMVAIDYKNNDNFVINIGNDQFDTLEVDAANGVDLKTSTVQIKTSNTGNAVPLTGTRNKPVSSYKWVASDGTTYVFSKAAYADGADGIGSLTVTSGAIGSSGKQLIIQNFDLNQAETNPNGYLGIKFGEQVALQAGATAADPFATSHADTSTLGLTKDGAATFTVATSADDTSAQTVTLTLSGGDASDYAISTGSNLLEFSGNTVSVSVPAGEDSATFSLVDVKDPGAAQSLSLSASLQSDDDSSDSNEATLNFSFNEAAQTNSPTNAIAGQFDAKTGITTYDGSGTTGGDDVATGNGPNVVTTYGGDDSITGGSGSDIITSGSGNDTIAAGGGQDEILVGNGNDQIYAGSVITDLDAAISNAEQGVATGQQGDLIGTGDGSSVIVGSNGNDRIQVGQGNNVIVMGPGNDVVMAGNAAGPMYDPTNWSVSIDGAFSETTNGMSNSPSGYVATATYEGAYAIDDNTGNSGPVGIGNDTIYGGKGDSFILLSNGDDYVDAGGGNDSILGGMGQDTIFGGTGDVSVLGGGGDTYMDGESGNDYLVGQGGNNTIYGGSGNDTIYAGDDPDNASQFGSTWDKAQTGDNYVDGGSGNDIIYGAGGNDTLIAGDGNTTVYGGSGNETLEGGSGQSMLVSGSAASDASGAGTTVLTAGDGDNTLIGGAGDDTLYGGDGTDSIDAGSGNQTIYTGDGGTADAPTQVLLGSGNSTVYGGSGVAQIQGGSGNDTMTAGTGDTTLQGGSATDVMYGGDGNDALIAMSGNDTMYAGAGDTTMQGGSGTVTMYGGDGTDEMIAGSGDATLLGGSGDTSMQGGSGTVTMQAGDGDEQLVAGDGAATIVGGAGSDTMFGGTSTTLMEAGDGETTMVGGSGQDTFQIGADAGDVVIYNFGAGDILQLASGVSLSDLTISDGSSSDGSINGLEVDLAGGGSVLLAAGNYTDSSKISLAGDGSAYTVAQLIANTNSMTTVTLANGSAGYQTATPDGNGHTSLSTYDSNGDLVSSAADTNDGHGNSTSTGYSPTGVETDTSYTRSDGSSGTTYFNADGSTFGVQGNADSTSTTFTDDGKGDITTVSYDAAGKEDGRISKSADGSSITDTYAADGSHSGVVADSAGDTTTTQFAADGTELSDGWSKTDGTSGSETFNADGSIVEVDTDAQSTTTTVNIDSSGLETSSTWTQADGTRGVETFNPDGSTVTTITRPDGTSTQTVNDGQDITTITQIDAAGRAVSDSWIKSDSSHGEDTFNADGSSSGTGENADGSSSQYVDDGHGNRTISLFDANGMATGDTWQKTDGSHGTDTINGDGSTSHLTVDADGQIAYSVTDSQGGLVSTGQYNNGPDTSKPGVHAQESAFATSLSKYLVSSMSWPGVTMLTQTIPVQVVVDDEGTINAGFSQSLSVTTTSHTVTMTSLVTTTSTQDVYDKELTLAQIVAMGSIPDSGIGSVAIVESTDGNGQSHIFGGLEDVGHTTTTTTSHPVTTTETITTSVATIAGAIEELDTGDSDHTIEVNYPSIVNAGAGNDLILAPSAYDQEFAFWAYGSDGSGFMTESGKAGSFLYGGAGNDTIDGSENDDVLVGGAGDDTLDGKAGSDTYLVFDGSDQGWDTIDDTGWSTQGEQDWALSYGGALATDTVAFQEGISVDELQFSWGLSASGERLLNISWGGPDGIHVVVPTNDERALREGIEQFTFADGTVLTMDQMRALAPPPNVLVQTGSDPYDPDLGYALSWTDTQFADWSEESNKTYTYVDGSTYSTDTLTQANGAVSISWSSSDGTSGSSMDDGQGDTVSTQYAADGSSSQTWAKSDGSYGTNFTIAATGENGGTNDAGDGSNYETWDNVNLANGAVESTTSSFDGNGNGTSYDTVKQADGSYAQSWTSTDGSQGMNGYEAATGVVTGSQVTSGAGVSVAWTRTPLAGGGQEQVTNYDYDDGSITNVDAATLADGASWHHWAKSDGTDGTSYAGATGGNGDTFTWGPASGSSDLQSTNGLDSVAIAPGVADDQLWFHQDGNDLDIGVLGTNDQLTIQGWYTDASHQLRSISLNDGETLVATDVQKLVDAMATFAVPDAGQAAYTPQERSALAPVLAATWH